MTKQTTEKKQAFLNALARTGNAQEASDVIGICRETAYAWRRADPNFAEAWEDARSDAGQILEDMLFKLAKGYTEITLKDGKEVPVVTKPTKRRLLDEIHDKAQDLKAAILKPLEEHSFWKIF